MSMEQARKHFSPEQYFAMSERMLKKHDVASIWLHWFNAAVWLVELTTGAALIVSRPYTFAPPWVIGTVGSIFESRAVMLRFHIAVGLVWIAVLALNGIFGFRHYLLHFLKNDLMLDRDDLRWFPAKIAQILGRKVELPEQGIYNAGQKAYGSVVAVGTLAIMITGLVMSFHLFGIGWVQWSIPIHFVAVGVVLAGLFVHVYMAAVLPEERPAFFSMFSGKVNELYAFMHHRKWWREMKRREAEFKKELESLDGRQGDDGNDRGSGRTS